MTRRRERSASSTRLALVALAVLAISVGCTSVNKTGPPTLPSGIDRVDITLENMNGPVPEINKVVTDPADLAALRESINGLPRVGKGPRQCATDRGSWTLTLTGKSQPTTVTFDRTGCLDVQVRSMDGTVETRQGDEHLMTQLSYHIY